MKTKLKSLYSAYFDSAIAALRREFRKWYGTISVNELAENRELVFEIGVLEKMLARQGV
jgi:hypothetical protein